MNHRANRIHGPEMLWMLGLRQRLILLVLIAVIPALVLILYDANRDRDASVAKIQEDAERIVEIAASRQARFIDSARRLLPLLTEVSAITNRDPTACRRLMKVVLERDRVYANLGVAGAEGKIWCSAIEAPEPVDVSDRSYFRRARDSKGFAIGDYQIGKITGKGTVNFGYPILNQHGDVDSVVYAALDLGWLTELNSVTHLPESASLTILDSQGTILARFPEPEKWAGKPVPDAPLFQIRQPGSQLTKELAGIDGVKRFYAFTGLGSTSAAGQIYVVVAIPKTIAFAEANSTLLRNLVWLGIACLSAIAAAWFIGNRIIVSYVSEHANAQEVIVRLAAIVESSGDAIIGMTLDGTITSWNDGAEVIYGYSAEEVNDISISVLNPPDRVNELPQILEIIKQGKGINRFETERIHKDGRCLYVSASISPIRDQQGLVVGASIIARDITALRKADEQLRAHASQLETLCLIAKEIGGTLALKEVMQGALKHVVSASGFDLALVRFAKEISGPVYLAANNKMQAHEDPDRFFARMGADFERKVQSTNLPWFVDDMTNTPGLARAGVISEMKALAVVPLSSSETSSGSLIVMSPRPHSFGVEETQFLQALSHQIGLATRNAQLYETMLQMNKELHGEIGERKRAEKALADFTAMVVHDLRSPLSNVVSITESIQDGLFGAVSEEQNNWLWKIHKNCKSLIAHMSDFLDFSKIDAGRVELVRRPVDLAALIEESLAEHSIQADKRDMSLKLCIDHRLPIVQADARRIDQVLSNLLSNALKFTRDGGEIKLGARGNDQGGVTVWVEDSGLGIPSAEIGSIFETYRQLSGGKLSNQKGTGLGLAICKKIVEAHGGEIWAESIEEKGSTFFFSLPVNTESSNNPATGLTRARVDGLK